MRPAPERELPRSDSARGVGFILARLRGFARAFLDAVGISRVVGAALLVLMSAATEGIGIALLVPLVDLLDRADGEGGRVAAMVRAVFTAAGMPLSLPVLLALFIGLIVLRAALLAWRDSVLARLELDFVDRRRRDVFRAIAGAKWSLLMRQRFSDLLEAVTAQVSEIDRGTYFFLRIPAVALLGAAQILIALVLSPLLTVAVLCWGVLLLAAFHWHFGSGYAQGERFAAARRVAFAEVSDFLHALKLAKSHAAEHRHIAAFEAAAARQTAETIAQTRASVVVRLVVQIAAGITLGIFVFAAVALMQLPTASVLVMVVIFSRLTPLILELQIGWQAVSRMLPVFDAVGALQARCLAEAEPSLGANGGIELRRGIVLAGVGFRYGKAGDAPALRNLSLEIAAGSTVAIVGRTGAGKSTLADLLLGLIQPTEGRILLDGKPIDGDRLGHWRRSVAYVPQDNFLFNDTVRQNLIWAAPDASDAEIAEALTAASADRFVAALPRGLDTVIGERGVRLSGGERQRLALARALLHRPTLLVLDEATSALDSETERAVQAAIERLHGSRTIVIVAHRLSTIRTADCIFVLEAGELLQRGTWEELNRDREGRFAALLDASHALPRSAAV